MEASLEALAQLSEAEAFVRWLEVPREWAEIPNERRGGISGVQRVYTDEGRLHLSQIRRHSTWDEQQWQAFMAGYRSSYGAAVPAFVVRR